MQPRELLRRPEPDRDPEKLVAEAVRRLQDADVDFLIICRDDGPMVGILTDPDIAVHVHADDLPRDTTGVVLGRNHFVVRCH